MSVPVLVRVHACDCPCTHAVSQTRAVTVNTADTFTRHCPAIQLIANRLVYKVPRTKIVLSFVESLS